MWAVLYLEDHPLTAGGPRRAARPVDGRGLDAARPSSLQWGGGQEGRGSSATAAITTRPRPSIWKLVSRVLRERELRWVQTALEAFEAGSAALAPTADDPRTEAIAARVAGLADLARVGAHLLNSMLEGEAIDSLPLKSLGELAKDARK